MQVGLEDDPTPLVRIIATTLSQSIANPDLARKAANLNVVCLDGGETRDFGDATAPVEYEIHGSADALTAVFSGGAVFGQDLLDGKVFASGTLQHASIITGQSIAWMMRGSA
jgi:hypothetical protein